MEREASDFRTQFTAAGGGDIIRDALAFAYQKGEARDRDFHHGVEADVLVASLEQAGFEIVPKPLGKDPAEVLRQQEAERRRTEGLGLSLNRGDESKQARFDDYARQVVESAFDLHVSGTPEGAIPSGKGFVGSLLAHLDQCGFQIARKLVGADDAVTTTGMPDGSAARVGESSPTRVEVEVEFSKVRLELERLKVARRRLAFEDIDQNPPSAAGHADHLIATWARGLGDAVEWCEARLLPRRLVTTVSLCRFGPSEEQVKDLDHRLNLIRALRGVVGVDRSDFSRFEVKIEIRFDYYITTVGCEYTPLDLPARPARKAA